MSVVTYTRLSFELFVQVSTEQVQPSLLDAAVIGQKRKFLKQLRTAPTFSNMAAHLEQVMRWCESRKLRQEKGRLTFLNLKCQRMKCLESEGCRYRDSILTGLLIILSIASIGLSQWDIFAHLSQTKTSSHINDGEPMWCLFLVSPVYKGN